MLALFAIPSVPFVAALGCALKCMILDSLDVGSYDLRLSWHIPDRYRYVKSPTNGKSPTKKLSDGKSLNDGKSPTFS